MSTLGDRVDIWVRWAGLEMSCGYVMKFKDGMTNLEYYNIFISNVKGLSQAWSAMDMMRSMYIVLYMR